MTKKTLHLATGYISDLISDLCSLCPAHTCVLCVSVRYSHPPTSRAFPLYVSYIVTWFSTYKVKPQYFSKKPSHHALSLSLPPFLNASQSLYHNIYLSVNPSLGRVIHER